VRPTDVLVDPADAAAAHRLARYLGLPRTLDRVAAWAALGTLAAILRIRDDGLRSAVVIDEGGPRSTLSRWARAVGFAPVEIDFTGTQPSVRTFDVDAGSLDVLVRIDPHGCDANDVDQVLEQASWALRPGGLLVITLPLGPPDADGSVGPADVRAIAARADAAGFVLVGDLAGELTARMREAGRHATSSSESAPQGAVPPASGDSAAGNGHERTLPNHPAPKAPRTRRQRRAGGSSAAYGLVRLVLRRR
jgi:SAM-dependent methyltransferase